MQEGPAARAKKYLKDNASERILTICRSLLCHRPIYDMCCDHGIIGLYAFYEGGFPSLHLIDSSQSVIDSLNQRLSYYGLKDDKIFVYHKDAASMDIRQKSSNIVIAGIGAKNMVKILDNLLPRLKGAHRLILGPQTQIAFMENYLASLNTEGFSVRAASEKKRQRFIYTLDFNSDLCDG